MTAHANEHRAAAPLQRSRRAACASLIGPDRAAGSLHAMTLPIPAFGAIGIELEYAIVARDSLDIAPLADNLLGRIAGPGATDAVRGAYGWSNELVLHVIEIKNLAPSPSLSGMAKAFANEVAMIDSLLRDADARLLPGAMHPWMNPARETRLWPHENAAIYHQFDRIFDCARHGWANLQSMHVNLPFSGDAQFARLHAAIRLALPIIPALAASSPFADAAATPHADCRLAMYRDNSARLPPITGAVIPETVRSRAEYEEMILAPIYRAIAPHDPDATLQHEWLNARGAIARFERDAIEIRVTDTQECPRADIAIAGAVTALVRMLYEEVTAPLAAQQAFSSPALVDIFGACVDAGEMAYIGGDGGAAYLKMLGYPEPACSAQQLWRHLLRRLRPEPGIDGWTLAALDHILEHGTLATRLRRAVGSDVSRTGLHRVYSDLADCLRAGRMFGGSRRH